MMAAEPPSGDGSEQQQSPPQRSPPPRQQLQQELDEPEHEQHDDADHHDKESGGESGDRPRRGLRVWGRIRQRVREAEDENADVGPLLETVAKDIDTTISSRRRRLNAKLAVSLKKFREETLNEVDVQTTQTKERRERLRARQDKIQESLRQLRLDILDEIEDGLQDAKRGGKAINQALLDMRSTWEEEVNDLVNEAKEDVDLAVTDIEDAIERQKEDYQTAIARYQSLWTDQEPRPRYNKSSTSAGGAGGSGRRERPRLLPGEIDRLVSEVKSSVDEISLEVEADLQTFKQRWQVTTDRLEALPSNLPNLTSLAGARMYVADTIIAGDVPALLTNRTQIYREKTKSIPRRILKGAKGDKKGGKQATLAGGRTPMRTADDPLGLREAEAPMNPVLTPTVASNLRLPGRQIAIVTTATLPWMTGTSINPLLRAAYLSKAGYNVTLVVPFLEVEQQPILFPGGLTFARPYLQEQYVRWWCANRAAVDCPDLRLRWYKAKWMPLLGCIIQDEDDISEVIPEAERDVVILEEPEHLNWYHHGERWTDQYKHVVGIAHTNYLKYARENTEGMVKSGALKEGFVKILNDMVCSAHTDVVVKLSATLPDVPSQNLVCNVHGVRAEFLAIGRAITERDAGAYFLGKADFTKGYRELIDHLQLHPDVAALPPIDTYGSGKDYEAIVAAIDSASLPITPHAAIDHAAPAMHAYRVFVNPSTSDVLCTATAEALAMGKKVVIPDHPSNIFFRQFSNTYMYKDPIEMVGLLHEALASEPVPMSPMEEFTLSWEAASERLLDAAALPAGTLRQKHSATARVTYAMHWLMGANKLGPFDVPIFDAFRSLTGAEPKVPWPTRITNGGRQARIGGKRAVRAASRAARALGDEQS